MSMFTKGLKRSMENNTGVNVSFETNLDAFFNGEAFKPAQEKVTDGVYDGTISAVKSGFDSQGRQCVKMTITIEGYRPVILNIYNLSQIALPIKLSYGFDVNTTTDLLTKKVKVYVVNNRKSIIPILPEGIHEVQLKKILKVDNKVVFSVMKDGVTYNDIKTIDYSSKEAADKTSLPVNIAISYIMQQLELEHCTLAELIEAAKTTNIRVNITKVEGYSKLCWDFKNVYTQEELENTQPVVKIEY